VAELVVVAPVFACFLLAFVLGGQLLLIRQQVGDMARTAAQAASDARSPLGASYSASVTDSATALGDGLHCSQLHTTTNTSGFRAGGTVTVTVQCGAMLPSLRLLGLPSTIPLSVSATAPIEPYRAVGP
jgi:hypothetical protein